MKNDPAHYCFGMKNAFDDQRVYIGYVPKYREYFINMRNEPVIVYGITHCPWCGEKLPNSLRHKWFETLKSEYNIDDPWEKEQEKLIPEEFKTDEWWKNKSL